MVPNPKGMPVRTMNSADRHLLTPSDDAAIMEQIQGTHAPDGREVDVKPLLDLVANILNCATSSIDNRVHATGQAPVDALDNMTTQVNFGALPEALVNTIRKIYWEIKFKWIGGLDAHAKTLALFNILSSYGWDAKVVLALAAFGAMYGEFWERLCPTDHLAKSIAFLKKLPEHNESLRPLKNIIKEMLDGTKCITEFKELPAEHINQETPALTLITTAVYWIIRSVVACAQQLVSLIGVGHESTMEAGELSSLAHKLGNMHGQLRKQLAHCYQDIDRKRHVEAYPALVHLFETNHIDNMKILTALINAHDDILPLYHCSAKKKVLLNLEILRGKNILLLISDLDMISKEELFILEQMYSESRHQPSTPESFYEVVWLPVVDKSTPWTEDQQNKFEHLQNRMPWYSVHQPSMVEPAVIMYIKEKWKFGKKPILVVLDPQGRVANQNALHMMWIWGSEAFPFTSMREDALWREETWRLELLVDGIDQNILNWMREGRLICLYGGGDMEWIRKFTTHARNVSQVTREPIELVYVGKSNPKERVRNNMNNIANEKLSHTWPDLTAIWFFWVRLESMWYSKTQHGKTIENDQIMNEIMTMLSFDVSEQSWAVIGGRREMGKARGETILTSFTEIDQWKTHVEREGFVPALNNYLHRLHIPHHSNCLILPGTTVSIPDMVVCAECGRAMDKFIMYR